jgi:hypothetical protein
MEIKDVLMMQLMHPGSGAAGGSFKQMMTMILLAVLGELVKHAATLCKVVSDRFKRKVADSVQQRFLPLASDGILLGTKHTFNKVMMKRDWKTTQESFQETNIMVDSVLNIMSKLDNVPRLQLIENTHSLVNYREKPFQVSLFSVCVNNASADALDGCRSRRTFSPRLTRS